MFVELFILCVILFVLYFEFNTLSYIFIKYIWKKLAFSHYLNLRRRKKKINENVSSEKKVKSSVKISKNLVKKTKTETKAKPKTEVKPDNKKQDSGKKMEKSVTKPPDKSVQVTTDKKSTKILPSSLETKKDKVKKEKSSDNSGDWTVVQKKVKKTHSIRSSDPSDQKNVTAKSLPASDPIPGGRQSDAKLSNVVKPLYKESVLKPKASNFVGRLTTSHKSNDADPTTDFKSTSKTNAPPGETNQTSVKVNQVTDSSTHASKMTSNELTLGFYRIKGNKAENDSKQYLDYANQNKRKFQTDYAKTVYKTPNNAWLDKSKTILSNGSPEIILSNETKSADHKENVRPKADSTIFNDRITETQMLDDPTQKIFSDFSKEREQEYQRNSSNVINPPDLDSVPSQALEIDAVRYSAIAPNPAANYFISENTVPESFLPSFAQYEYQTTEYGGGVNTSSPFVGHMQAGGIVNSMILPDQRHALSSAVYENQAVQVFSDGRTYSENFNLYGPTEGFIGMPPVETAYFQDVTEKVNPANENEYRGKDLSLLNFVPENIDNASTHFNRDHSPLNFETAPISYGGTPSQYIPDSNSPFYPPNCDINVNEKNYGLSDEQDENDVKFDSNYSFAMGHDTSHPYLNYDKSSATHFGTDEMNQNQNIHETVTEEPKQRAVTDFCSKTDTSADYASDISIEKAMETCPSENDDDEQLESDGSKNNEDDDSLSDKDEDQFSSSDGRREENESPYFAEEEEGGDSQEDDRFSSMGEEDNKKKIQQSSSQEEIEEAEGSTSSEEESIGQASSTEDEEFSRKKADEFPERIDIGSFPSSTSNHDTVHFQDNYFELQSNEEISKILGKEIEEVGSESVVPKQESEEFSEEGNSGQKNSNEVDLSKDDNDRLIQEQLSDALLDVSEINKRCGNAELETDVVSALETSAVTESTIVSASSTEDETSAGGVIVCSDDAKTGSENFDAPCQIAKDDDSNMVKDVLQSGSEEFVSEEFSSQTGSDVISNSEIVGESNSEISSSLKSEQATVNEQENASESFGQISCDVSNFRASPSMAETTSSHDSEASSNSDFGGLPKENTLISATEKIYVIEEEKDDELMKCKENLDLCPYKSEIDSLGKARPRKMVSSNIRVLTINDGEVKDETLYRLEKDWTLEFRLGPSLFGRKVKLFVNYPEKGQEFHRNDYHPLTWSNCSVHDDCAKYAQIQLHTAGSFHYYFTYDNETSQKGSGYFLVDPVLMAGNETLPLDCIQSVTYLSKLLGPFSSWENKLRVAKETGYNMIHFTPVQELGGSNSAYSLRNQLKLNVTFNEGNREISYDDVAQLTNKLRNEWKVLSICDIVLNHTANESPWIHEHPECAYNLINSPHLKPAYLLDITLDNFSNEISKGKWEYSGIPPLINSEEHLSAIKHALYGTVLPKVKIFELFTMDVDKLVVEFQAASRSRVPPSPTANTDLKPLKLIHDPEYRRLTAKVDMEQALSLYNIYRADCFDEETRLKKCSEEFKKCVQKLNDDVYNKVQGDLGAAVENFVAGARYYRIQGDGPRWGEISEKHPLSFRYFTDPPNGPSEEIMYSQEGRFVMAHNGWVMNADPLQNFAAAGSDVYLRRELIAWGDSVKLRYGDKPEDCPYLWNLMSEYVKQTVKTFDGVRLDNCHSTPIVVAQYLLDVGRRIKPNLYVVAELFTNSDGTDNIFVNKLGITSLIREAMSAWDSHEEGRLVYRYGGVPVGAFIQPSSRPLVPSVAHALFLDQTHDNPSPVEKRTVFDLLPSSALVSMACCGSGSNMGYDLLVPHHIHVVDETRSYLEWGKDVNLSTGIIGGKRALNNLHFNLGKEGYSQVFVDQIDGDIVCVTRHNDITHETVILVAYTAFHSPSGVATGLGKGVTVSGQAQAVILEATLSHRGGPKYAPRTEYKQDPKFINGLDEYSLDLKENIDIKESAMLDFISLPDGSTRVNFTSQFKPGCVVAVKILPHAKVLPALQKLSTKQDLSHIISKLSLTDLNKALYCCAEEGSGCYEIPAFGRLVYAGIQGVVSLLSTIAPNNDLGHPLCGNLRDGHWLMDFTSSRLKNFPELKPLGDCLEQLFAPLKDIPRFLVPSYFNLIIMQVYEDLLNQVWSEMSEFVSDGSAFSKGLALGSVQLGGIVSSSPLPKLSDNLLPPRPVYRTSKDGKTEQLCASLSAGLPHFSHGYMRNWGRDTFIALRGLFLLTGRYQEARYIILAFGGCLRHGLIPNLLDGGNNPRFNCRDAVWWWLYTIQSYVETVPQGHQILNDVVNRIFPTDDSPNTSVDQPLAEVIQEAMSVHFQGLTFRERNAGTAIDAHMVSQGFDNQIGVNPSTGFVFGGNEWNCGTWMDKMGSSEKAGIKGRPATPRDGSAVELIGLCKAAVRWLAVMHEKNLFLYSGVTRTNKDGSSTTWTYAEWNERIQNNFEKHFWVSPTPDPNEKRPDLVNRKGIYKDTVGATQPWTDYQLRPNFTVAMVVAPELFTPSNAWTALEMVEKVLLGPLGMKTLDPTDWCYDGNYDNSNDSSDAKVAHGFNYHQGPEWLWPVGFFLRAKLMFAPKAKGHSELSVTISKTLAYLSRHYSHLQSSVWRGLPELTNKDGAHCSGSCTVQAWSMSTILEVLEEISKLAIEAEFENINDPVKL